MKKITIDSLRSMTGLFKKLAKKNQFQKDLPGFEPSKELKNKKNKQDRKDGRRTIVVLFLVTFGLSLVFYLKAEIPILFEKLTSPLVISTLPDDEIIDSTIVIDRVEELTKDLRGTYGFFVYSFADGRSYGLNQDEVFPAASLMKLPVILALYKQAEVGSLSLDEEYILTEADKVGGAGILQNQAEGAHYTYRQLAELMGQQSDNTAFAVVRKKIGDRAIEEAISSLDMGLTSLEKFETTPKDIASLFQELYEGKFLESGHLKEVLSLLTNTAFEDRIPVGLPEGVSVAHKVGTDLGVYADAGIVFADEPFVLVIVSKDARESEASVVISEITAAVWNFQVKGISPSVED